MLSRNKGRAFKPTNKGGGSKPGKPQPPDWPMAAKIIADAVHYRAKGSMESELVDRNSGLSAKQFEEVIEVLMPGFWEWIKAQRSTVKTPLVLLLKNRRYYGTYEGTALGNFGDPFTRASAQSSFHWRNRIPSHDLRANLWDDIVRGRLVVIPNWMELMALPNIRKKRKCT